MCVLLGLKFKKVQRFKKQTLIPYFSVLSVCNCVLLPAEEGREADVQDKVFPQ